MARLHNAVCLLCIKESRVYLFMHEIWNMFDDVISLYTGAKAPHKIWLHVTKGFMEIVEIWV